MPHAALEYILNQPLLVTPEKLELALAIVQREELPENVASKTPAKLDGAIKATMRDGVAVVPIQGPIFRYANFFAELCGGATVENIALDLANACENRDCHSILLMIDSPGGEANGISELAAMIRQAGGSKPVCAYVGGQGCSAAYWLASAAGSIVCSDTAVLGSIGTVVAYPRKSEKGKTIEFVSSQSPNKRPNPETDAGKAEIQRLVDDMTAVFIGAVAKYRGVSEQDVMEKFGAGGMLVGANAVKAGMADRIGSFEATIGSLVKARHDSMLRSTERTPMSLFSLLFKPKADGTGLDIVPETVSDAKPAPVLEPATLRVESYVPVTDRLRDELAATKAELLEAKAKVISTEANAWYTVLLKDGKIVPAERDAALSAFVQASLDDESSPLKNGAKRASFVAGIFENRTPHTLTKDRLPDAPAGESLSDGLRLVSAHPRDGEAEKTPTKERILKLMEDGLVREGRLGAEALEKIKASY